MKHTVYLLEDDNSITSLVDCALSMSGIRLLSFSTVADFNDGVKNALPDLAILDIMLPDGNGLDVLTDLKSRFPELPIIMMSALISETDKVVGLNKGADDYISKPFGVMEMTARVNAALRRVSKSSSGAGLTLNEEKMQAFLNGKLLDINNKEFKLLSYLLDNKEIVLSREKILSAVWGYETGETRTLDNHVARLRKLGIEGIKTVHGVGYTFRTGD